MYVSLQQIQFLKIGWTKCVFCYSHLCYLSSEKYFSSLCEYKSILHIFFFDVNLKLFKIVMICKLPNEHWIVAERTISFFLIRKKIKQKTTKIWQNFIYIFDLKPFLKSIKVRSHLMSVYIPEFCFLDISNSWMEKYCL